MDPISLSIAAVGLGLQVWGGMGASEDAERASEISKSIAREEQSINAVKQKQMELEGRRTQMENIRNNQRARAMSESAAVNQGAQFGSGLQGGLAQIDSQTRFNMFGVSSALTLGREIAGHNDNISGYKMDMADVQASSAQNQGLMSLGGAVMKAGPLVGQLSQGFGGSSGVGMFSNGGNDGAAPRWS